MLKAQKSAVIHFGDVTPSHLNTLMDFVLVGSENRVNPLVAHPRHANRQIYRECVKETVLSMERDDMIRSSGLRMHFNMDDAVSL
jgi:hypothetical protein